MIVNMKYLAIVIPPSIYQFPIFEGQFNDKGVKVNGK